MMFFIFGEDNRVINSDYVVMMSTEEYMMGGEIKGYVVIVTMNNNQSIHELFETLEEANSSLYAITDMINGIKKEHYL